MARGAGARTPQLMRRVRWRQRVRVALRGAMNHRTVAAQCSRVSGLLLLATLGCATPPADQPRIQQQNQGIVRRLHEDVWTRGNVAAVDELVAPHFVSHFPGGPWRGVAEFKDRVARLRRAFPDWSETEEASIASGNLVVSRWTSRGTHLGDFDLSPDLGHLRIGGPFVRQALPRG